MNKKITTAIIFFVIFFIFPFYNANAAINDDLISFWSLNEDSGDRVDSIGSNDLSETSGSVSSVAGKIDSAGQFTNGATGYLSIANNSSFNIGGGDFTLSLWVYLDNLTGTQVFASKYGSGGGYALYFEALTDAFMFATYAGSNAVAGESLGLPDVGTWYHVVGVHDSVADTNTIIINDEYEDSVSSVTDQPDTDGAFSVGAFSNSAYVSNARVDAVGLWSRKLTSEEITYLYNSGDGVELVLDETAPVLTEEIDIPDLVGVDEDVIYYFSTDELCNVVVTATSSDTGLITVLAEEVDATNENIGITLDGMQSGGTYSFSFNCVDDYDNESNTLSVGPFTISSGDEDDDTESQDTTRRKKGTSVSARFINLIRIGNLEAAINLIKEYPDLFQYKNTLQNDFPRDLFFDLSGDDVKKLQEFLISQGYSISAGATGYFGNLTKLALISYQKDKGIIPSSGYFGPITKSKIKDSHPELVWW